MFIGIEFKLPEYNVHGPRFDGPISTIYDCTFVVVSLTSPPCENGPQTTDMVLAGIENVTGPNEPPGYDIVAGNDGSIGVNIILTTLLF